MINVTENRRGNLSILDNPDTIARKTHNEDKQTKLREKRAIRTPPTTVEGDVKLQQ